MIATVAHAMYVTEKKVQGRTKKKLLRRVQDFY